MQKRSLSVLIASILATGTGMVVSLPGCAAEGGGPEGGGAGPQSTDEALEGVELVAVTAPRVSVAPDGTGSKAVIARVTVLKSTLFGMDFLYGADLQYSAKKDAELDLTLQSLAIGHDIVRFSVVGENLLMTADQSHQFESDVNKPGRLVHSYKILRETSKTLTFEVAQGSPVLATVIDGSKAPKERTSWVRDVQYDKGDKLMMFATSIESADGGVYEFMESVFPRRNLVPEAYAPLSADPASEPLADRFRFLSWGLVWVGTAGVDRAQTQFANRFRLEGKSPVAWYVTANIPDKFVSDVKNGVDGWNRYSQAMWKRDMVTFKGKLPAGVSVGDPRYNVINWDNVADAGAAYESQASDPLTGIQSHSLIYMPLAWVNIGRSYWQTGELSEARTSMAVRTAAALEGRTLLGRPLKVGCLRDASAQITLEAKESPELFGKALLRGTLFHEIGHAWGLAHNFKGSLLLDDDAHPERFTTSIMDYNQYNLERGAFASPTSATGPLLEYDRQIISALYNGAADIKTTDAVLPACADDEADDLVGGVDPLCIRYDAGADPTKRTQNAIALITTDTATQGTVRSLPSALRAAQLAAPAAVTTLADAKSALSAHAASLRGLLGFYISSGAGSVRYMTQATLKMLYTYKPETLPASFDEAQLRAREFEAVEFVANLEALPAATSTALDDAVTAAEVWFKQTGAYAALPAADRAQAIADALAPVRTIKNAVEGQSPTSTLARVRYRVLGELKRVPTSPFAYQSSPGTLDYEAKARDLLERLVTTKVVGVSRSEAERVAYIGALKTYADTDAGKAALGRVRTALQTELAAAPDALSRESLRTLLSLL